MPSDPMETAPEADAPEPGPPGLSRRLWNPDRTQVPVGPGLRQGIELGRRYNVRERYDARMLTLVLGILLLSVLDAIFTLLLIDTGMVEEWNPVLAPLVENDPLLFAHAKMAVTGGGLIVLAMLANWRLFGRIQVYSALYWIFSIYVLLLAYHLVLAFRVAGI